MSVPPPAILKLVALLLHHHVRSERKLGRIQIREFLIAAVQNIEFVIRYIMSMAALKGGRRSTPKVSMRERESRVASGTSWSMRSGC
jgi:hypothetical protein